MTANSPSLSKETTAPSRRVSLVPFSQIEDDVPTWAWDYDGKGRIAVGSLGILAGRPGAGKSTAGRWYAAGWTRGTIPGAWQGTPVNVCYLAAEESAKYVVKPGLRAAGADMSRIFQPAVEFDGEQVKFLSSHDMSDLADELVANGVRVVILDPLMSTLGGSTDINRNNEVRALVEPWAKLAERIDGIVLAIAHLNKSGSGDVVAGINGSSAFGEVARSVFGFVKDPESEDGDRIMSQEKNSIGEEDLALTYRIESHSITTDSGKSADVGRFVLIGNSERTAGEVLRDAAGGGGGRAGTEETDQMDQWLLDLLKDGPVLAKDVYADAGQAGYSTDQAKRAKARINARARKAGHDGELVEAYREEIPGPWSWRRTDVKGADSSPTPVDAAPLRPSAPLQVNGGDDDALLPQGSKGAAPHGTGEGGALSTCPTCSSPLGSTGRCVPCITEDSARRFPPPKVSA